MIFFWGFGRRFYEEYETSSMAVALEHEGRIMVNDPTGQFIPWYIP